MIAPNGKKSNLTDSQYKLVRTPAFKEWFGDWEYNPSEASKVVDENGEPLVVYHGTNTEFFIFGEGKNKNILDEYQEDYAFQKKVNYFHKSKEYSETFGSKYGGYEKSFFLDIKKIALVDEDTIEDIGYWKNIYEYNVIIKQLDGIYSKSGQYATLLNPHQIKLADGTNTTFDGNNPDIRFNEGGLIAPNGKPSNLTPEQYKLVRTKSFKDWFGDWENDPKNASKVVDENGEPLVCRHYSQKPIRFNEFTKQKPNDTRNFISFAKEGYYFSSTDKKSIEKIYNRSKKGLLYEVFLNVKNILDLGKYNAYDFTTKKAVNWKEFTFEMLQKYVIKGRVGSFDDYTEYNENVNAFWMDEIDEKAKNQIFKLGYNGVWGDRDKYADSITDEFYGTDQIVVFNSNQIKLADGTNTTFDGNNPDIRFNEGGVVPKTSKDEYGNWGGEYLGNKFSIYNLKEGWKFSFTYYSPLLESEKNYFSSDDYYPFKTKKDALNTLMDKIKEINEENESIIAKRKSNNPDIRFMAGGNVEDLISKGIVELKMFDTKPEHAKEYGFDVKKPLYVESICITENERLKGIGRKVLDYIDEYAVKNGHDLVFGHITQKANFTKDSRHTDLCDIDLIKNWLHSKGYAIQTHNNDFHKVINNNIRYKKGGMTNKGYVSYKDKYNTKYGYSKGESHDLKQISKDTGVSMKGLQQIYNKGIGAYKTNPSSVRPSVKSKEQWAMARVYSSVMGGKASKIDSNELKMEQGGNINFKNNNMSKHKDGLFVGKSHKEGGIPMVVKSTGQRIEVEGGESITNKTSMADDKIRTLTGTNCEIISQINTQNGNGVALDCNSIVGKKYEYKDGGMIFEPKFMHPTNSKMKSALKNDFNINFKQPNIYYPKQSLGLKRSEMPQIRKQFLPILFETLSRDGIKYEDSMVNANTIKPSQNEINIDFTRTFNEKQLYEKNVIVSSDNYVIDGHHRWYYCLENNIPVKITKIDLPIEEALNYIRQLDFIEQDEIAKRGMLINSQKSLFGDGGGINNGYFKNEDDNNYINKINEYFNKWNSIKNEKDSENFKNLKPTMFGTYQNIDILEQINNFEKLKVPYQANEVSRKQFKKEVYNIIEKFRNRKFAGGGNVNIKGKIKGKVIHKEYGIEYYDNGNLIQPTQETKSQWEIFGFPNNIEKKEQSFETIIDEIYGNTQKEISNKFDNNLINNKYSYLGFNPNLSLIYDKSKFGEGGNIEVDKYSEEIPMSIYDGVIGDFDNDNISNADDLQPNVPSKVKLEEISLKDELTDIIKYRNLFVDVQKKVLSKIKKINTCGKIQCEIKTRIKTPYSIINKLRRRSLTDVKTLDKLDKKAKEFLKNKNLKGIDLYKGLTDVLGFMVIVEDFNFLNKLKSEVEAGNLGEVLEFEDFYKNDLSGYRAYHFLLSTEVNGTFIPYELQLRTMRVNELAKITHTIYKQGTMNSKINDKIAKEIELADKGNKVIAKIIDKKLENKDLLKKQLTIQKLAFGDIVASGFLSSYKYKVRNDVNKLISSITEYADNEAEARKDLYRKYKNFTLLGISVNDGDYVPINEYVENKKDRSQIDLFNTEQRFEYAREMKKGGVIYRDLSTIKPQLVMDLSEVATPTNILVDEVSIVKTGEKFVFNNRKINSSNDSYKLLKDFWNINNINVVEELNVILLDKQNKPISIYRHSKGGIDATIGDIEVISAVVVKTLAKGVIVSHNHPSGNLTPSPPDLEISKQLKNALKLFNIVLLDSLIVTETDYYSMADNGVFKLGGHIDSDCDCSKCRVYDSTIIIDEADTKKGKMFLIKLRDLYYIIYDDEIIFQSSELKYAKKGFESNLYYDKLRSKNTFAKGGMITDAEYSSLEKIVPKNMLASIKETKESWERGDSDDVFEHYENLIEGYREIPKLYFQDEKGFNSVVYLHYFSGGSDWYITELDKKTNEAYGYAILNGDTQNSEFGYMNLNEFANSNIQIDLYWSFKTLNEIFENKYPELVDGEIEYYNKDATLTRLTNFEVLIEKNDFKNQYEVNQFIELMIDEKLFESNNYTTIEKSFLQRYSGMGGLQKYGATGKGILWEYYTPKKVADIMWALAYKHKSISKFDRVLENSVGVGTFVNTCPLQVGSMDCYDISKYAIAICLILYGKDERFQFFHKSFETLFFIGNSSVKGNVEPIYDLVIGNPPYSEYSGKYAGLGEKKYTKATNYIDYFIFRSLDLLKSGGLLVYILGSVKGMGQDNWLESKDNYTKEKIKEKAELVDALRLGSGVFEFTDVDSDIIVLRKK